MRRRFWRWGDWRLNRPPVVKELRDGDAVQKLHVPLLGRRVFLSRQCRSSLASPIRGLSSVKSRRFIAVRTFQSMFRGRRQRVGD
jgi:hypothetical protein